jgi:REP element-mobilizing transposase RayT
LEELNINYWSHGPHYQFRDSIVFITWRLAGTMPARILNIFRQLKASEKNLNTIRDLKMIEAENARLFRLYNEYDLNMASWHTPGFSLNDEALAAIVTGAFHFYAGEKYELHAYCVMSNHVHLLIRALKRKNGDYYHIADLVRDLKRHTASEMNKMLGRRGQFWDDHYFDRIIRNERNYLAVVGYILQNPVVAGLVGKSEFWKDSFYDPKYKWGRD